MRRTGQCPRRRSSASDPRRASSATDDLATISQCRIDSAVRPCRSYHSAASRWSSTEPGLSGDPSRSIGSPPSSSPRAPAARPRFLNRAGWSGWNAKPAVQHANRLRRAALCEEQGPEVVVAVVNVHLRRVRSQRRTEVLLRAREIVEVPTHRRQIVERRRVRRIDRRPPFASRESASSKFRRPWRAFRGCSRDRVTRVGLVARRYSASRSGDIAAFLRRSDRARCVGRRDRDRVLGPPSRPKRTNATTARPATTSDRDADLEDPVRGPGRGAVADAELPVTELRRTRREKPRRRRSGRRGSFSIALSRTA